MPKIVLDLLWYSLSKKIFWVKFRGTLMKRFFTFKLTKLFFCKSLKPELLKTKSKKSVI